MPDDDSPAVGTGSSAPEATRIGPRLWALPVIIFLTAAMTVGQITVLGKQVFDMTGKPLDLGLLGLAEFVPTLLLAPLSGVLSDRFDRRLMYACGLAGEAAASAGLYFYVASDPTSVMPIFALVFAFGSARSVLSAAQPGDAGRLGASRSGRAHGGCVHDGLAGGLCRRAGRVRLRLRVGRGRALPAGGGRIADCGRAPRARARQRRGPLVRGLRLRRAGGDSPRVAGTPLHPVQPRGAGHHLPGPVRGPVRRGGGAPARHRRGTARSRGG